MIENNYTCTWNGMREVKKVTSVGFPHGNTFDNKYLDTYIFNCPLKKLRSLFSCYGIPKIDMINGDVINIKSK